jgi:uncharacterized protein (DUF924 family)
MEEPMTHDKQKQVLDFWFGDDPLSALEKSDLWFGRDPGFDDQIRLRFADMVADGATGAFDDWAKTARGALALVLLLDQFPRNIFRGEPRAFANDVHARRIAEIAIDHGLDHHLSAIERVFLYLPLEHSEDLLAQQRAVDLYMNLVDEAEEGEHQFVTEALAYALSHRDIIERFGRFPHRNDIVGRESNKAERDFLKTPFSAF